MSQNLRTATTMRLGSLTPSHPPQLHGPGIEREQLFLPVHWIDRRLCPSDA